MPERPTIVGSSATTVRLALKEGITRLRDARVPSHALAAELLLLHTLGRDRAWLYSHPEVRVDAETLQNYRAVIESRAGGKPTQYLIGKQEFWGLEFEVNSSVLIPRPETEHVVEVALSRLARFAARLSPDAPIQIVDVGTGSGCIAVALARELPRAQVFATDISSAALEVAQRNAARHGVADRVRFVECDLFQGLVDDPRVTTPGSRPFTLIVSNPPYVARADAEALMREVREHEPDAALFGGPDGNDVYPPLIAQSSRLLLSGGILVLELGYNSADYVRPLLANDPSWADVEMTRDLAGIARVISAQRM